MYNLERVPPHQRHRSLISGSFTDRSNSLPSPSAVARDAAPMETTLACIHYRSGLELAMFAEVQSSASTEVAAAAAAHFGQVLAALLAGD